MIKAAEMTASTPAIVVKMKSGQNLHRLFRRVSSQTSGTTGQNFVVYDCTDYAPSRHEYQMFLRAQSTGMRGSITDPDTFTILVGDHTALPRLAEQFEDRHYGGVSVGIYPTMDEALYHAREGRRIFSCW